MGPATPALNVLLSNLLYDSFEASEAGTQNCQPRSQIAPSPKFVHSSQENSHGPYQTRKPS
jgi:hypothetical protein